MLVLSRRENEQIVLPDLGITLEVVKIKGNRVRIGIAAPDSVRILRGELNEQPTLLPFADVTPAEMPNATALVAT